MLYRQHFLSSLLCGCMPPGIRASPIQLYSLLELMLARKHCTKPEFTMLKTSFDFNGQFGHHESILVSLLASPEVEDRQLAINTIFTIREQGPRTWNTPSGQRPFQVTRRILKHTLL